jgi:hypothetical protein
VTNLAFRGSSFGFRSTAWLVIIRRFRSFFLAPALFFATSQSGSAVPSSPYGFYTLSPCRIVDTRNAAGPYGGPALTANSDRSFVAWGRCGIPSGADAIALNVTVTGATSGGDFRIYPGGTSLPMASTINYAAGRTRANNGAYRLGSAGDLVVHVDQASGSAHLILDVSGYFETADPPPPPPPSGGSPFSKWYQASGEDSGKAVVIDGGGNALVVGQFQGIANFGSGPVTSYTNSSSGPTIDAFVAKYSASGVPAWSRGLGGNSSDSAAGVAVDSGGNVVVTGYQASSTVDYGAGLLSNRGITDIFVAKYSSGGGHVWSKTVGGTSADAGTGVAVDSGGNVVVTGQFDASSSGVDFGGGALFSAGAKDVFLVKYSSAGAHVWSKRLGGSGYDLGGSVAVDGAGNVVVVGTFEGTINLGGGSLTSAGERDLFVAKFSPTGQHIWSKRFGGARVDWVRRVAADGAGDVFLTGQFLGTINFGGSAMTSAGNEDIFLAKLSGVSGGHVWSKRLGSTAPDAGYGVAVDGGGNVAITGFFAGSVDFGGGTIVAQVYDIFVAKYSSAGTYISARRYGDPVGLYESQYGDAIAMSGSGTIFITGHFVGTLDFGAAGQATSVFAGGSDAYLSNVGP